MYPELVTIGLCAYLDSVRRIKISRDADACDERWRFQTVRLCAYV